METETETEMEMETETETDRDRDREVDGTLGCKQAADGGDRAI